MSSSEITTPPVELTLGYASRPDQAWQQRLVWIVAGIVAGGKGMGISGRSGQKKA